MAAGLACILPLRSLITVLLEKYFGIVGWKVWWGQIVKQMKKKKEGRIALFCYVPSDFKEILSTCLFLFRE